MLSLVSSSLGEKKKDSQHVGIVINFMCACAVTRCPLCVPAAGRDGEMEIVTVSDPSLLTPSDVSAIALDFKVLHPVVITRLGVFPSRTRAELQSNVTVKLLQLDQEVTWLWPVSIMHRVCCVSVELGRNAARGQLEDSVLLLFVEQTSAHFRVLLLTEQCVAVFSMEDGISVNSLWIKSLNISFFALSSSGGCGYCSLQLH